MDWDALVEAATRARERSYSPYSSFAVGAAALMEDGTVVPGCNVENRTFGLTVCAERTALVAAVARGLRRPQAIAVVTSTDPPSPPCGLCLETLTELGSPELPILLANLNGDRRVYKLADLLPHPFVFPPPAGPPESD